jgi:small multidrug resistance family-3 protein
VFRLLGLVPAASIDPVAFAGDGFALALVPVEQAGRTYAVYGGIYIAASLAWLWMAEGVRPDRWDVTGAAVSLIGASIILWAPRTT